MTEPAGLRFSLAGLALGQWPSKDKEIVDEASYHSNLFDMFRAIKKTQNTHSIECC